MEFCCLSVHDSYRGLHFIITHAICDSVKKSILGLSGVRVTYSLYVAINSITLLEFEEYPGYFGVDFIWLRFAVLIVSLYEAV